MSKLLAIFLTLILFGNFVQPVPAQTTETFTLYSESGRFSVDIPATWGGVTVPRRFDLDVKFLGDNLIVADTHATLEEWLGTGNTGGSLLMIRVYPIASYGTEGQNNLLDMHMRVYHADLFTTATAEETEISGYPARKYLRGEQPVAAVVLTDYLVYDILYAGRPAPELDDVVNSLTIHSPAVEQFPRNPLLVDETLAVTNEIGWLVMDWGYGNLRPFSAPFANPTENVATTSESHYYVMMPDHQETLLTSLYRGLVDATSPNFAGLYVEVDDHPYDALFGSANAMPTTEEQMTFLEQFVTERQGVLGEVTTLDTLDAPTLYVELPQIYGANNRGAMLLIDTNRKLYTVLVVGPQTEYPAERVDEILARVGIQDPWTATLPDEPVVGFQVGQIAPNFALTTLDGTTANLEDYQGKLVLLNFWALWCRPCREEMPILNEVAQTRDDVVILSVNFMDKPGDVQKFVDELGLTFPMLLDQTGEINQMYHIYAYPTNYLIDGTGIIRSLPRFAGDKPTIEEVNAWFDAVAVE